MSRSWVGILTLIAMLLSVMFVCLPVGMHLWRMYRSEREVNSYEERIYELEQSEINSKLNFAKWYNLCLSGYMGEENYDSAYGSILDIKDGMMGYVEIERGRCRIPIFHSTQQVHSGYVLTHMHGSALPLGGKGNHTILHGPQLVSRMEEGDVFTIQILGKKLDYTVERVQTVTPGKTNGLLPSAEEDRCTLITTVTQGYDQKKRMIHGIRTDAIPAKEEADRRENLLALFTVCFFSALIMPFATGIVGFCFRRILRKVNCGTSTN